MDMKRKILLSLIVGVLPLSIFAQDDMYYVPKKVEKVEKVTTAPERVNLPAPKPLGMSVDEYNRRYMRSSYQTLNGDSLGDDIIDFTAGDGYPMKDTIYVDGRRYDDDYYYSARLGLFDDYYGWYNPFFYDYLGWRWGH